MLKLDYYKNNFVPLNYALIYFTQVLHIPGHTTGSIGLLEPDKGILVTGKYFLNIEFNQEIVNLLINNSNCIK